MGFGTLLGLTALAAIAYTLEWRLQQRLQLRQNTSEAALDILKARYARGEINTAEYNEMRDQLTR